MPNSVYKNTARGQRQLITEQTFRSGMQYTDVPLNEGFNKVLLNYELKDSGAALTPRGGWRELSGSSRSVAMGPLFQRLHHISQMNITDPDGEDNVFRYALFAGDDPAVPYYVFDQLQLLLEDGVSGGVPNLVSVVKEQAATGTYRLMARMLNDDYRIHSVAYTGQKKQPLFATLNNKFYAPAQHIDGETTIKGLATLTGEKAAADADYTVEISMVEPRVMTPTEAVNYGYNMLREAPYTFDDQISPSVGAGYIILGGVLPYEDDACSRLCFNAKVGQWITFRLFGEFHDTADTFKFRWELRDLESDDVTVYSDQDATASLAYHYDETEECAVDENSGKYIRLRVQPPYKQFSVTVTAYSTEDLSEPIQVMSLATYSLSVDGKNNLEVKNYDLSSATGMAVWQQRLVLWGVRSGRNILFVSDVNNPSYFPYPNNAEVFDEDIIACIPHLSDLLVFTESKLHRLTWAADGLSYTSKVVQDKLMLSMQDRESVQAVKNMVFFKNGNYYYMVVPGANAEAQELQLAPISRPITRLLDNFLPSVSEIISTVYNPSRFGHPGLGRQYAIRLIDFHNYLDNAAIRNVYKFELCVMDATSGDILSVLATFDFILNYDSMLRTWTTYVVESNRTRMVPYRQTITDTTTFINLTNTLSSYTDEDDEVVTGFLARLELVQVDTLNIADLFTLDAGLLDGVRRFRNWQYIDTGHREQNSSVKKRYRELQFRLNNISQKTLEFGVEFGVDDEVRKDLFKYVTSQADALPGDADYGWIYVLPEYAAPLLAIGATMLEEAEEADYERPYPPSTILTSGDVLYSNRWVLDYSKLSRVSMTKLLLEVSGKGYSPQLKLLSFNEQLYELLSNGWVFRMMNAR